MLGDGTRVPDCGVEKKWSPRIVEEEILKFQKLLRFCFCFKPFSVDVGLRDLNSDWLRVRGRIIIIAYYVIHLHTHEKVEKEGLQNIKF